LKYRRRWGASYDYLGGLEERPGALVRPLLREEPLRGVVSLSAWARAPLDRPRVYLLAGRQVLYAGDRPGSHACCWDTRRLPPGPHTPRLVVADREGRPMREVTRRVRVAPDVNL